MFVGAGSSDGAGAVVSARSQHACTCRISRTRHTSSSLADPIAVRVRRPLQGGHEVVQVDLPAVVMGTQLLGEPRYPSLRGIMAARSRRSSPGRLADLGIQAADVGWPAATTRVVDVTTPPARGTATVVSAPPADAAAAIADLMASLGLI